MWDVYTGHVDLSGDCQRLWADVLLLPIGFGVLSSPLPFSILGCNSFSVYWGYSIMQAYWRNYSPFRFLYWNWRTYHDCSTAWTENEISWRGGTIRYIFTVLAVLGPQRIHSDVMINIYKFRRTVTILCVKRWNIKRRTRSSCFHGSKVASVANRFS